MPVKSERRLLYDRLATILASTHEQKTAGVVWNSMRDIAHHGDLFLVALRALWAANHVDELRDQVYRNLDVGVAYTRIAEQLRLDHRLVRQLKQDWLRCSAATKELYRAGWSYERRHRDDIIELGRAAGNVRTLARRD